jgi:hypothetical protein
MTTREEAITEVIEQAWMIVLELRAADMDFGVDRPEELSTTFAALEKLEAALMELKKVG